MKTPKGIPGQLVRLTRHDYQLLREALIMADHERGGTDPERWPEFDEMSNERWASLAKIREAVYPSAFRRLKGTTS